MKCALPLLALALALTLAFPVQAHVESYAQSRALTVGPYLVFFEPRPTPPFANNTVSMVAQVSDGNTGSLLRNVPATVLVGGPADFSTRQEMQPDGTGYLVASMVLPERGNYSARILIRDDSRNETWSADTEFEVFPDIPYRIRPVDAAADTYTGELSRLAFEIVDPITLQRKGVQDLAVKAEHWTEDHTQFLGEEYTTPERVTQGVWRIEHVFQEAGMYHIRFASASGGFNYADVPLLHVYATAPPDAGERNADAGLQTPGAGIPLIVLAAALAAVVALARRKE